MSTNATPMPPSTPMHSPRAVELPMAPKKPMVVRVLSQQQSNVARRLEFTEGMSAATLVGP